MRQFERPTRYIRGRCCLRVGAVNLRHYVHVADRAAFLEASALIAEYGELAVVEAANRADRSRSLGNVIHFCRWRQVERTIEMLSGKDVTDTVH